MVTAKFTECGSDATSLLEILALCKSISLPDARELTSLSTLDKLKNRKVVHATFDGNRTKIELTLPLYGQVLRENISELRRRYVLLQQADRIATRGSRRREDVIHTALWSLAATGTHDSVLVKEAASLAWQDQDIRNTLNLLQHLPADGQTALSRLHLGSALSELGHSSQAQEVFASVDSHSCEVSERLAGAFLRTRDLAWVGGQIQQALDANDSMRSKITATVDRELFDISEGVLQVAAGNINRALELLSMRERNSNDSYWWTLGATARTVALTLNGRSLEGQSEAVVAQQERDAYSGNLPLIPTLWQKHASAMALSEAGNFEDARRLSEDALADSEAHPFDAAKALLTYQLGRIEWLTGRINEARHWFCEAVLLARPFPDCRVYPLSLSGLAACEALNGNRAAAQKAVDSLAGYTEVHGIHAGEEHIGEAWLLASQGQLASARALLQAAADRAKALGQYSSEAMLLTEIARLGGAKYVTGRLDELACTMQGRLARARARFASAMTASDPDELLATAAALEKVHMKILAAEAVATASAIWRKRSESRRAANAILNITLTTDECPGVNTPALARAKSETPLTEREAEVALLAASGAASKTIASRLDISVRTVDNHLQRVFVKLGVSARKEINGVLSRSGVTA
ncbi:LuxR C-terminal-related transcriptional regulator [Streptomyces sp. NPDC002306]